MALGTRGPVTSLFFTAVSAIHTCTPRASNVPPALTVKNNTAKTALPEPVKSPVFRGANTYGGYSDTIVTRQACLMRLAPADNQGRAAA